MNSKQRKLKYIRTKNHLRRGGEIYDVIKVSHGTPDKVLKDYLNELVKNSKNKKEELSKKYKLNIIPDNVYAGSEGTDLVDKLFTLKVSYKKEI